MRYVKSYTNDAAIQAAVDDKSLGKPYVALDENTGLIDWNTKEETPGLTFRITSPGGINIIKGKGNIDPVFFKINDTDVWTGVNYNSTRTISVQKGDIISFKGTVRKPSANSAYLTDLKFSGSTAFFVAYGNIMSIIYGDDFAGKTEFPEMTKNMAFGELFRTCSGLTDASKLVLPKVLPDGFSGNGCYTNMFRNCANLVKVPELPATTLGHACYKGMFQNCTSLTTAPELPATTLASYCYDLMFYGCTSLTSAPVLPAATLVRNGLCYAEMFENCTNLSYIKCLAEGGTDFNLETQNWVSGVSPTGTFVKKAGVNWPTGASGIPSGWTVIEE